MTELLFELPNNRYLLIRNQAIEKMNHYRQLRKRDKEAGGILIGRILLEDDNFIVDDVSEPMKNDVRHRTRFKRSPLGHQEYFNSVWECNHGHCFYLGEWHTHPEQIPTPSTVDLYDWNENLKRDYETDALFFLIVGIAEIKVWYGNRKLGLITGLRRK
jgi:integrative and conjugative element protein (TIGR02256 family)